MWGQKSFKMLSNFSFIPHQLIKVITRIIKWPLQGQVWFLILFFWLELCEKQLAQNRCQETLELLKFRRSILADYVREDEAMKRRKEEQQHKNEVTWNEISHYANCLSIYWHLCFFSASKTMNSSFFSLSLFLSFHGQFSPLSNLGKENVSLCTARRNLLS